MVLNKGHTNAYLTKVDFVEPIWTSYSYDLFTSEEWAHSLLTGQISAPSESIIKRLHWNRVHIYYCSAYLLKYYCMVS